MEVSYITKDQMQLITLITVHVNNNAVLNAGVPNAICNDSLCNCHW